MGNDFEGKVVLISGAAGGMGMSISETFAKMRASLVLTDLSSLDSILERIKKIGSKGIGVEEDLGVTRHLDLWKLRSMPLP